MTALKPEAICYTSSRKRVEPALTQCGTISILKKTSPAPPSARAKRFSIARGKAATANAALAQVSPASVTEICALARLGPHYMYGGLQI